MTPVRLLDLPHTDARRLLARGEVVWLPVNPVEYHGPHLPLHTDRLLTEAWIADLHRALGHDGAPLVADDLEVGVEPTPGPGSRPFAYREVRRAVIRAASGLRDLGARRIAVVTFHGAPLHNLALARAVGWLQARGVAAVAPFQEVIRELGAFDGPAADPLFDTVPAEARAAVRADLDLDFHAGFLETSLMLHWAPQAVSPVHRSLPPCPPMPEIAPLRWLGAAAGALGFGRAAHEMRFGARAGGWNLLRPFPGYTGHPAHANAEAGRLAAEHTTAAVAPVVAEVLAGKRPPPAPPFRWVGPLTLWGRLGPR